MDLKHLDLRLIELFRRSFIPFARFAMFVVFFWFGILKLFGLSPASPVAKALTEQTVGLEYFTVLFLVLAAIECLIGLLFLIPKATRVVILLLFIHMLVVSAPLILTPSEIWSGFLVLTLEGQYIIKNIVIVAVAIGIAAQAKPFETAKHTKTKKATRR